MECGADLGYDPHEEELLCEPCADKYWGLLPNRYSVAVKGGVAHFDNPPSKKTLDALNVMADLAYKNMKKINNKCMNAADLKENFHRDLSLRINVSTKIRNQMLLNNDTTISHGGLIYNIKFKNIGGGIWEAYTEKR